jgi:hypothetical protein
MSNFCAFDTEDDSERFQKQGQDHPGYEKVCTQIAAIDGRTGERFHYNPLANRRRKRGRWHHNVWDIQPFLDWLEARGPKTVLYAHNLSYDIGNIWWDRLDELDMTMVGARLVRARWKNITLLDSFNMWPMALKMIGDAVGLKKLDMDINSKEYVFRDVEIVLKAMDTAQEIAGSYGVDLKSTLGSLSIAIWSGPVMQGGNWQCSIPDVREAYYGGRVELFRPEAKGNDLYYCDINSLYPSVMCLPFPTAADLWFGLDSLEDADRAIRNLDRSLFGVAKVRMEIPDDVLVAPLPVKREGSGEVCFPIGPVEGWWTVHEIRYAMRKGARLLKVTDAFGSEDGENCYKDFVHTFYRLRQAEIDQGRKDGAKSLFYKLLMNNLYGQLGMRGSVSRTINLTGDMVEPDDDGNWILTHPGIPFGGKLLTDVQIPLPDHVNYMHAAYVTSYGRLKLMEYMDKVGANNLIYCDTDSIFFRWRRKDLPFPLSSNLGEMKLEDRPKWVQTRAPKMYRYELSSGERKTKAKGVPKKHQDTFYDEGVASFWQPFRLRESIASANQIPEEHDENVKVLGVWRQVIKRKVSGYDKKRLKGGRFVPKKMVDIGADHDQFPDNDVAA